MTASRTSQLGTVVEAVVEVDGKIVRRLFFRTAYTPNPWVAAQDVRDRAYYDDADLRDVVVLFAPDGLVTPSRTDSAMPASLVADSAHSRPNRSNP